MKLPGIIWVEVKIRDDIWVIRQKGSLSVKEMDHKLFICRVKSEPGWKVVDIVVIFSH